MLELVQYKYQKRFTSACAQADVPFTGTILNIQIKYYFLQYFVQYIQYFIQYFVQYFWYVYMLWLVRYKYQKCCPSTSVQKAILYCIQSCTIYLIFASEFFHQQHQLQQLVNSDSFDCYDSSLHLCYIDESEFELYSTLDNHGETNNNFRIDCTNTHWPIQRV